jgi:hypothetical protein
MNSLDKLMFDLNDHVTVTKTGREPLLDATYLGTLQLRTHRALLEAAIDQPRKSLAVFRALANLADAHAATKPPKVTDAIRLIGKLRDALMDQRYPSDNVKNAIASWVREMSEDAPAQPPAKKAPPKQRKREANEPPDEEDWMN